MVNTIWGEGYTPSRLWCAYNDCGNRAEAPWDGSEMQIRICFKHLRLAIDLARTAGGMYNTFFGEHVLPDRVVPAFMRGPGPTPEGALVYYISFGDRIKIGTTTNLAGRLQDLPYDEVLATEPGSYHLETRRHHQFHRLRIVGEWFERGSDLLAHIETLRTGHVTVETDAPADQGVL